MPLLTALPRFLPRRTRLRAAMPLLVLAAAITFTVGARAETVRLIAFNDFHGHLEPGSNALMLPVPGTPGRVERVPAGGAPWLAGLIAQLRTEVPRTVVFSSGDMVGASPLASTLFRHESTVTVMNMIGLDFAITGNHEFDGGLPELRRLIGGGCAPNKEGGAIVSCAAGTFKGAQFPLLAANVVGPDGKPVFAPTLVKELDGVKIGFIGVVTRTVPTLVSPLGIADLTFRDEADTINQYAAGLRAAGVGAIVAVVHEGGDVAATTDWNDPACGGKTGEIFAITDKLSADIDVVFSAHTHKGYNCTVDTPHQKGLRIIQGASFGRAVSVVDVDIDLSTGTINRERTQSRNIPVVNRTQGAFAAVPSNQPVSAMVDGYSALAAPIAGRKIGSITGPVERTAADVAPSRPQADGPAGRMVADAQLAATRGTGTHGAQIALTNQGGIRTGLPCMETPPCAVTYGQAFTMQPFGNALTVLTLTGAQIKDALEQQRLPGTTETRFLQPSRGLSYTWTAGAPDGGRVSALKLNGADVLPEARYRVTVNSFLAEGGDGFSVFTQGKDLSGGPLDADALVDFLAANQPFSADPAPRIKVVE